jgi:hypothetical protein
MAFFIGLGAFIGAFHVLPLNQDGSALYGLAVDAFHIAFNRRKAEIQTQ